MNGSERAFRRTFSHLKLGQVLQGAEGQAVLHLWMRNLEEEMSSILRSHSKLFWLFSTRQILPYWYETLVADVPQQGLELWLYHILLTSASLRYGLPETKDVELNELSLGQLDYSIELDGFNEVDFLDFLRTAAQFLRVQKLWVALAWEGRVAVLTDQTIRLEMPESQKRLRNLYISRREAEHAVPAGVGLLTYLPLTQSEAAEFAFIRQPFESFLSSVPLPSFSKTPSSQSGGMSRDYFLPVLNYPVTLKDHLGLFREVIKQKFELSVEALMSILRASTVDLTILLSKGFSAPVALAKEPQKWTTLELRALKERGMSLIPKEQWLSWMQGLILALMKSAFDIPLTEPQAKETLNKFYQNFVLQGERYDSVTLETTGMVPFLYELGAFVITDFCMVMGFVEGLMREVASTEQIKGTRSESFENAVRDYIPKMLAKRGAIFKVWGSLNRKNELRQGGRVLVQVDLALQISSVLFLIEVKSFSLAAGVLKENICDLNNRWSYMEGWIAQCIKQAEKLSQEPIGDNYSIPDDVHYLVPLICSHRPEPIWEESPRYFVTPSTPRILTVREIVEFLASMGGRDLAYESEPLRQSAIPVKKQGSGQQQPTSWTGTPSKTKC